MDSLHDHTLRQSTAPHAKAELAVSRQARALARQKNRLDSIGQSVSQQTLRINTLAPRLEQLAAEITEALNLIHAELDRQADVDAKLAQGILALAGDTSPGRLGLLKAWFRTHVYNPNPT